MGTFLLGVVTTYVALITGWILNESSQAARREANEKTLMDILNKKAEELNNEED